MRIAYLAAGAAGMYCGSCLHDNTLAAAMLRRGADLLLVPTYTPMRTDEPCVAQSRVFLGGINMYLEERFPWYRRAPAFLRRWLDSPRLLRLATSRGASIDPGELGGMTVSMLAGRDGHQRAEVETLVHWLATEVRPDIVHLPNTMLLGIAAAIRHRCDAKIVVTLSGEDLFLEKLDPPHYQQARELIATHAQVADGFVAMNRYYAEFMGQYLPTDRERIHVIPHGLDMTGYPTTPPAKRVGRNRIGYLARICHDKGLHLLLKAAELLRASRPELDVEIVAAGYLGPSDRSYFRQLELQAARGPLADRFCYAGEPDKAGKIELLRSFTAFALPTVYRESKGLSAIEALAAGVPVVLPEHGSFPELVSLTGGGVLHRPLDPQDLAEKLAHLLDHAAEREAWAARGQLAVHTHYTADAMAARTLSLYEQLLATADGE